jgi:hypothetical protein
LIIKILKEWLQANTKTVCPFKHPFKIILKKVADKNSAIVYTSCIAYRKASLNVWTRKVKEKVVRRNQMNRAEIIDSLVKLLLDDNNFIQEIVIENEHEDVEKNGNREMCLTGTKTVFIKLLNKNQYEDFTNKKFTF